MDKIFTLTTCCHYNKQLKNSLENTRINKGNAGWKIKQQGLKK